MTRQQMETLTRQWQRRLRLSNWEITIDWDEQCPEDADAATSWADTYDFATMKFSPKHVGWTDAYAERTVIHELIHLHDRDRLEVFEEIETCLSPDVYRIFSGVMTRHTEGLVDRLATCFYELANSGTRAS